MNGESGRALRMTGSIGVTRGFSGRFDPALPGVDLLLLVNDVESLRVFADDDGSLAAAFLARAFEVVALFDLDEDLLAAAFLLEDFCEAAFFAAGSAACVLVFAFAFAFAFALGLALLLAFALGSDLAFAFFAAIDFVILLVCPSDGASGVVLHFSSRQPARAACKNEGA